MMILNKCAFETTRLLVKEWHSLSTSDWRQQDLANVVSDMLTEPVTRSLPPTWQGDYTVDRGQQWIIERDGEGTTLLVVQRTSRRAVGLMILNEAQVDKESSNTEIRLGYLLSENAWGKGFATELVSGFIKWCRGQSSISLITGGVASDNLASIRVLEKSGFQLVESSHEIVEDEKFYRLGLR